MIQAEWGEAGLDKRIILSKQIRDKWLLDAITFIGGCLAAFTGIYFLYVPTGGYQGGRNVYYKGTFLFERSTWEDLHIWGGVIMVSAVLVHLVRNWQWVVVMSKRVMRSIRSVGTTLSQKTRVNVAINLVLGLSFMGSAISGIHFLLDPGEGFQGGRNQNWGVDSLHDGRTWDMVHTWAGVVVILAAVFHLIIHWRWIVKVTQGVFNSWLSRISQKRIS